MLEVVEEFNVASPIDAVYSAICNVGEIGYALAGVKSVEVLNDDESLWKIEVRAGIMARTLTLNGRIVEREPPNRIAFAAVGPNLSLAGSLSLTRVDAGMTHCMAQARSEVTGRLAPLINLVAKTTQKQLIAETIANFRKLLARGKAQ